MKYFSKEEILMTNKDKRKCSKSLDAWHLKLQ